MKHVVMIITNSPNPSYFRPFAAFCRNDTEVKISFVFLHTAPPSLMEELENLGSKCYYLPFFQEKPKPFQYIRLTIQLFFLFLKIKPDVVQTNLFDDSLPGLLAARIARVKSRIITKQDTNFHILYYPQYIKFDKFNNFNATIIVPVSAEVLDLIMNYEHPSKYKIRIVHHGMDENFITSATTSEISQFKKKYGLEKKFVIGCVSRYVEIKGYKQIIEAAEILCSKHENFVFLGMGSGPQKTELLELIKEKKLSDKFILTDKIEYSLIPSAYKSFDVFIHNSINEAFGFVFPEAMFNKIPIVSTNVGAVRDVLKHKESCYFTQFNSVADIVNGIEYMLEEDRAQIAERAFEICKNNFSIEKMWKNYRELFLLN